MGMTALIFLHCDGSPECLLDDLEAWDYDGGHETRAECRAVATKEGWRFCKGNKAYCPKCVRLGKHKWQAGITPGGKDKE